MLESIFEYFLTHSASLFFLHERKIHPRIYRRVDPTLVTLFTIFQQFDRVKNAQELKFVLVSKIGISQLHFLKKTFHRNKKIVVSNETILNKKFSGLNFRTIIVFIVEIGLILAQKFKCFQEDATKFLLNFCCNFLWSFSGNLQIICSTLKALKSRKNCSIIQEFQACDT